MENKENKKKSIWGKSILIFLVLFVLPLGSLYFLGSGVKYRKASLKELSDLGKTGMFELMNQNNQPVSPAILRSKVAVVNFLSDNLEKAREQADRIAKIHQSFDDTEDVMFLSFIREDQAASALARARNLGITDNEQWFLLETPDSEWARLSTEVFKNEEMENGVSLIDTSMTIRRHYDINSDPEMGRLVEHIAIVIPKQKRR